ncbi:SMP-30/gluconolactonase/LRE family protein [Echinimonas agarilytica]|uniref:SMP-30/gluconolactonase/LRE family protein n=1 Tax=Echinimonas agarilytica TaxID=1215918 RepID=A0AA41WCC9_9GAMM|nr:SMP-30/gluconolactonase/LRE family protein [Echinimonas agarilytica]MCM2681359.1 SMP-30/gluconolactonase/LRE family protein [Echinimonas agarilytica]
MSQVKTALKIDAKLGECPRWDEQTQTLFWVDIDNFRLNQFDPKTGTNKVLQLDEEIGCFALREKGGFVAGLRSGYVTIDSLEGGITPIADPEADKDWQRFNDGRCDAAGRFIAGTLNPRKDAYSGHFYSLDQGTVKKLVGENWTSNGLAFSPDSKTLYYSDTPQHKIFACDYDLDTGTVGESRIFAEFPLGWGRPDGASVDADGNYWSALYGGGRVVQLNPQGEIINTIAVPAKNPTMVAFGGSDLKTLYITTTKAGSEEEAEQYPLSGSIFAVEVEVAGAVEPRYKGE